MADLTENDLQPVGSWAQAIEKSKGYGEDELVSNLIQQFEAQINNRPFLIEKGNETIRIQHLLVGFFLSLKNRSEVSIGDFGGANGYMHDYLTAYVPEIKINYKVFEPTKISSAYNKYSKEIGIEFLDINQFHNFKFDLIIISCTLQYVENWKSVLETSFRNATMVLLMRVPLIDELKNEFLIQHTSTGLYGESSSSWPVIFFSKYEFIEKLKELSDIQFSGTDYEESFPFNGRKYYMSSYLLKSKLV
jgi:putative methyltransferase (TIGR04325 family)